MAKRSLEEADFVWDVGWTLSQPHKSSVFDLDVVELKESNVLGHYLRAKKIFVRPCYKTLFPQIWMLLEHSPGVAILGTAGIGKSLFGVLILIEVLRWLRQKNAIWLAVGEPLCWPVVYATETDHFIFSQDGTISKSSGPFCGTAGLLLLDGMAHYDPGSCRYCIWLSCLRPSTFKQAIKKGGFERQYMPPWTADELVTCWKLGCASNKLFDNRDGPHWEVANDVRAALGADALDAEWQEAVLRRWVNELGPVPRRVFIPREGAAAMAIALREKWNYSSLVRSYDETLATTTDYPHSQILLMVPKDENCSFVFVPATSRIARRIFDFETSEKDFIQLRTHLTTMQTPHLLLFQPYVEHVLSMGGRFEVRLLEDNTSNVITVDVSPCVKTLLNNQQLEELKESAPNTLYLAEDADFPYCWTNTMMFKSIVNNVDFDTTARFFKLRTRFARLLPPKLVNVVPKTVAEEEFHKLFAIARDTWDGVEQYVLRL